MGNVITHPQKVAVASDTSVNEVMQIGQLGALSVDVLSSLTVGAVTLRETFRDVVVAKRKSVGLWPTRPTR